VSRNASIACAKVAAASPGLENQAFTGDEAYRGHTLRPSGGAEGSTDAQETLIVSCVTRA